MFLKLYLINLIKRNYRLHCAQRKVPVFATERAILRVFAPHGDMLHQCG